MTDDECVRFDFSASVAFGFDSDDVDEALHGKPAAGCTSAG